MDDKPAKVVALLNLADIERTQGQIAGSEGYMAEALQLAWDLGDGFMVFRALEQALHLAAQQQQWERAARLSGALEDMGRQIIDPAEARYRAQRQEAAEAARTALGTAAFNAAYVTGQAMTTAQTVAFALTP
ncbi:MAG TPA: hypothetical protein VKT32_04185, partial [Chthonomonadaceae bacterium]|nr:hypothetical protein [Chthonomonadaceae bacterium]